MYSIRQWHSKESFVLFSNTAFLYTEEMLATSINISLLFRGTQPYVTYWNIRADDTGKTSQMLKALLFIEREIRLIYTVGQFWQRKDPLMFHPLYFPYQNTFILFSLARHYSIFNSWLISLIFCCLNSLDFAKLLMPNHCLKLFDP